MQRYQSILPCCVFLALSLMSPARAGEPPFEKIIQEQQGRIPREALDKAFAWFREHPEQIKNRNYITIINFDLPSTARRMYVIDLKTGAVEDLLVAHGKQSGENYATKFSNTPGSNMSSLGIYLIDKPTPTSKRGMALLLDGMEPTNSKARPREILLHGAPYVSDKYISENGRLGRSLGCPAVDAAVIDRLIEQLQGGSVMLIYASGTPTTRESDSAEKATLEKATPAKALPGEEAPAK